MLWDTSTDDLVLAGAAGIDLAGDIDVDGTANLDAVDIDGAVQIDNTVTVGVDDTGYDVKFFGNTASAYMLWDTSADDLVLAGAAGIDLAGDIDVDGTANLDAVDIDGAVQIDNTVTVGVDDTSYDVKFFGASAGAYMEWDESADELRIMGASADATTSTGKLLLATSLTNINANDVLGKIDFQAPHESGGTDAITVAASIRAIAQGTFSSSVNATDLIFYTGHSEAATEKFRFTSEGEIGIGGANYGSDGQVLTSAGAGAAAAWETVPTAAVTAVNNATANELVTIGSTTTELDAEANLTFDGTDVLLGGAGKLQLRDTGLYVASNADGDLDIVSDGTAVDSINIESAGGITLDAGTASSGIIYEDDGTEMLRIYNSSSDVIIQPKVNGKDLIIHQYDGNELVNFNDGGYSTFTRAAYFPEATISDGATPAWDVSTESCAKITIAGNRTIGAPSNGVAGQFISLLIIQDGTGSRTMTWNAVYEFASDTAPTLTTTADKADLFVFRYHNSKWLEVGRTLALTVA
jgi:hypothetical protein